MATNQASHIATSSCEEGLDLACNLLVQAIRRIAEDEPVHAPEVLHELAMYVQLRYVGELLLALEYLAGLGRRCRPADYRSEQFWPQLWWVAGRMQVRGEALDRLELLQEYEPNDAT